MTIFHQPGVLGTEIERDVHIEPEVDTREHKKADRWMIGGALASGSFILGPVGIVLMLVGFFKLKKLEKAGTAVRPWMITIIGLFCCVDAGINMIGWSVDMLLHDTVVGQTVFAGYGRLVDGGYYMGYNALSLGGTQFVGEKICEVASVLIIFPMRIAAAWAFFRMKQWGLQMMIVTSWMYAFLWVAYLVDKMLTFQLRFGTTEAGFIGFWAFNLFYWTPFLMLPYLYSLKRGEWRN
jgi:hypothetical protein